MGRARRLAASRKVRIALNAAFMTGALAAAALTILHFVHSGWPLANADPLLVMAAGILFLFAYAFKAWGWQRLFREDERPEALTLAAAGGAASVGGVALPGRFDEAIRIAVVRRGPGPKTTGLGAICLTLIIVGLLDSAALTPMASVAAAASHSGGVQAGFALVAAAGVAAAALVLFLPRIAQLNFISRWKVGRWLKEHTACPRSASQAWLLISVSWALRGVAVFVLLNCRSAPRSPSPSRFCAPRPHRLLCRSRPRAPRHRPARVLRSSSSAASRRPKRLPSQSPRRA
jgi:hypothetical protein